MPFEAKFLLCMGFSMHGVYLHILWAVRFSIYKSLGYANKNLTPLSEEILRAVFEKLSKLVYWSMKIFF